MRSKIIIAICSVALVASASVSTFACACCAERGTYDVSTTKIDSYYDSILEELQLAPGPELFMTEAGFDAIEGLGPLAKEFETDMVKGIDLVDVYTHRTWTLRFRSPKGNAGELILPRPASMVRKRIYIPDNDSASTNVWLYKELVLTGRVRRGTGLFASGVTRPAAYTLIFQGQGNNCDSADQFTNWRLEVSGSRAKYAWFGKTNMATPAT